MRIEEYKKKFSPSEEITIFDFDNSGHYENRITNFLSFYFKDSNEHGMSTLFIEAFLSCLDINLVNNKVINCYREMTTKNQNRIDLILEGDDWLIIIENKINHTLDNPLNDYKEFIESKFKNKKKKIYVILSLEEYSDKEWQCVTYPNFIGKIGELSSKYDLNINSKWYVYLHDFITNIRKLSYYRNQSKYLTDRIRFIFQDAELLKDEFFIRETNQLLKCYGQELVKKSLKNQIEKLSII